MNYITDDHKQTAVYWGTPADDGYGGKTFADPVEINCRWEQRNELFMDAFQRETVSNSVVFVGQDLDIGGYLLLGDLDDLSSDQTPENTAGTFEIRAFRKIPDIDGTDFERKAFL